MKTYFFGWTNIKWFIKEIMAMYSSKPSYFSKKRFESSISFFSGLGVMLSYIWKHRATIQNSERLADVTILFIIAGYSINQIQQEKKITGNSVSETSNQITSTSQPDPQPEPQQNPQ